MDEVTQTEIEAEKREREFFANLPKITDVEVLKNAVDSANAAWARAAVLRQALMHIEKHVRGLSTGERKSYLLVTIQRVREIARNALNQRPVSAPDNQS